MRFWIIVIPETEKPCLETTVCWAELRRMGDAEPLLGELNVRVEIKALRIEKEVCTSFPANKTPKRLGRTY